MTTTVESDAVQVRLLRAQSGHGGLVLTVRVLPAALLLVAVHLLLTGSRLARSWWWQDDLKILATVTGRALTPDRLLSDVDGHLAPGTWALAWLLARADPLQWWPAALITLILVAATDLAMLAVLHRLFGGRPAVLLPLALFCATPLALTGTLWWTAAMRWLPVSLALLAALWFHLGYLLRGRRGDATGALLAVVAGLLFSQAGLITPALLLLFTVGYAAPGPLWRRPWTALRADAGYWAAQAALAGGCLWLYRSRVSSEPGSGLAATARRLVTEALLPGLVGAPLDWATRTEPNAAGSLTVLAVLVPLALALAWLPRRGELNGVHHQPEPHPPARGDRRTGTAAVAIVAITAAGAVAGEWFMTTWSRNPNPAYVENLRTDLAARYGPTYLFDDEVVPATVMAPELGPDRQVGRLTRLFAVRPVVGPALPSFSIVDAVGHLHDGTVAGTAVEFPVATCATPGAAATVELPVAPAVGVLKLRLGYYANRQSSARIAIGRNPAVPMRVERGLNEIYVSLRAGGSTEMTLDGVDDGASVCIGSATVGPAIAKN